MRKRFPWVSVALERLPNGEPFTSKQAFEHILSETNNRCWDFPSRMQLGNQLRFDIRIEKIRTGLFRRK